MNNVWVESANNYMLREVSTQKDQLPAGIYKFQLDQFENPFLTRVQDKFHFPYKVYGVEREFINRVVKSWQHTNSNYGVLLNGLKGTGKTVTAELIANEIGLPVIIIPFHHSKVVSLLNEIQQDVIVFVDEFEKIYDGYENSLLTIMDGVLKSQHRIFFLLTTNELRVDRNLMQRPSRVRYVKTFSDLSIEVIMEVVKDKLIHTRWYDDAVRFISELPIITMDLVKSIVEEINIHDENPDNFKDVFNIHLDREDMYNVYRLENGEKKELHAFAKVIPNYFDQYTIGNALYVAGDHKGKITKVISDTELLIEEHREDEDGNDYTTEAVYILEKAVKVHRSFNNFPLAF